MPIVQYAIVFPKQRLLPGRIDSDDVSTELTKMPDQVNSRIPEQLSDHIEWEPQVDDADKVDYIVAVSSGVIAGLIDAFFTGELSFDRASDWGADKVERIVKKVAQTEGYTGDSLSEAIRTLEKNHPLAADGNTNDFGGGKQHHFRDFAHHFSIGGLAMSIFTQFTGLSVGTNTGGDLLVVPVPESHRQYLGKNFQEKITFGTIEWFFHMISDMAGSSGTINGGTGIPGPLVSFMKEISALPFFKKAKSGDSNFRLWLSKLFNGTRLADHDACGKIIKGTEKQFDLRMEIGLIGELGRQAAPVLLNQCLVRGFYFCSRLFREIRDLKIQDISDLSRIAPESILPWGTPAMRHMVTVSSGVFTTVDFADAAVRGIQSGTPVVFLLRINYVGIATFVVACVADAKATHEERKLEAYEKPEKTYERKLSDLGCLKLDFQKARILHSLMRQVVLYDIQQEKHDKTVARKSQWLDEWSGKIIDMADSAWNADAGYFLDDGPLYDAINTLSGNSDDTAWLWLVAMEVVRFKPYTLLHGDKDKNYKGLKPCSDYVEDVFCQRQGTVDIKSLRKLNKSIDDAGNRLDHTVAKRITGSAGTLAIGVATGGVAFYLAPVLAPVLAATLGAETIALSGAALTNASLAFLGGGAIASGGLGMAGGTALIAGGGALLGAVGGTGITAATSMTLTTNGHFVHDECAKLLAFCEEVLIERYGDLTSVREINTTLNMQVINLQAKIEEIKRNVPPDDPSDDSDDATGKISSRKMLKVLKRSLKYYSRSNTELSTALKKASDKTSWA